MTYSADKKKLMALKAEGHNLIDKLVEKGYTRQYIYTAMRHKLNRTGTGKEHFAAMTSLREARDAIKFLENLPPKPRKARRATKKVETKKVPRTPKNHHLDRIFARKNANVAHDRSIDLIRKVGRRNQLRKLGRFKRFLYWVGLYKVD